MNAYLILTHTRTNAINPQTPLLPGKSDVDSWDIDPECVTDTVINTSTLPTPLLPGKSDVDNWEIDSDDEDASKSKSKGLWDKLKLLTGGSREVAELANLIY